jgi:hypothetical protein
MTLRVLESFEHGEVVKRSAEHDQLIEVADYFVRAGSLGSFEGLPFHVWQYEFDYPYYGITRPWRSGMAQGHAIELLVAAYRLTGHNDYRQTAVEAANALEVPIDRGGTAVMDGPGIWFEEYASPTCRPPQVLNGHNFALNGLWHLALIEPGYLEVFDQGVIALKNRLSQYDRGVWSNYDGMGTPANRKYHKIHCEQLRELFARTGDPSLGEHAQKFSVQLTWPFHVLYRLVVYPNRMLVALVAANSLAIFWAVESIAFATRRWQLVFSRPAHLIVATQINKKPLPETSTLAA